MDRCGAGTLRALPRLFIPGASAQGPIDLPPGKLDKLRKVLRLGSGDKIAILPNDGTIIRCELAGRQVVPIETVRLSTEPTRIVRLAQSLPKGDKLDEIVRFGTEIGVSEFLLFSSDRTVVRWDRSKLESKLHRLNVIAMEAAELAYRSRLPVLRYVVNLTAVLKADPSAVVLSELQDVMKRFGPLDSQLETTLVVGPEGGWSPSEVHAIGPRAVTLGPRVLRVEAAAIAACALALLPDPGMDESPS